MKVVLAGAGACQALRPGAQGTVLASLSRACYLHFPGGLVALVGPGVHPGPLHLVLDGDVPRVGNGAQVSVADRELVVAGMPPAGILPAGILPAGILPAGISIDLRGMSAWGGALPPPPLVRDRAALLREVLEGAAHGSSLPAIGTRAMEGLMRLEAGDIEGAVPLLGGLGPGLTPAGDDALAGAVFAVRAAFGPPVEPALVRLVGDVSSGRISLAFLAWAARGQALAPAHDLVSAAVRGEPQRAATAARALAAVGALSGADFALGLHSTLLALTGESAARPYPS